MAGAQGSEGEPLKYIVDIDAGMHHSVAVDANGYVWAWGDNDIGQLGNGSNVDACSPVWVLSGEQDPCETAPLEGIMDVSAGTNYSYAVDSNGHVWAWGDGDYGQLGNGKTGTDYWEKTPVQVKGGESGDPNLENIVAVSAGERYYGLALDENGYVWAWGDNGSGQLGDGTATQRDTPVQVETAADTPLTNIVYIDAGYDHSTAIDKNGDFWVWGNNWNGQLGLGYTGDPEPYAKPMP